MMLKRLFSYRFGLPFLALALGLALSGCDSGVRPGTESNEATTVQFASSGAAVTIADETASVEVSISNPNGQSVSVEVLFAQAASTADATDLGLPPSDENAFVVETVSFPAGAEDGDTQSVTFNIGSDEPISDRLTANFALQNLQSNGQASIGTPREFELSIGFPSIREVRTSNALGDDVTVQGTVTRIDRGTAFMQDDSGGMAIFDDVFAGEVSPGDRVIVSGELDVFAGLLEIVNVGGDGFSVVSSDNAISPETATLAQLEEEGETFESTLVRVEDLSFEASGTFQSGTNYTITDGSGGAVQLRVPSQSFYVGQPIPSDPVTFKGVLSQFNGAFDSIEPNTGYQLLAISEGDLSSVGDGGGGGGPEFVSIDEARQSLGEEVIIEGTVSRAFGVFARVQDDSGPTGASGIVIRQAGGGNSDAFQGDIESGTIQPGTTLQLTGTVTEFNGVVQINGSDLSSYEVLSQGNAPSPQSVTLADLESGGEDYESELVEITDLTFPSASGTFENGTNYDVTDGTATLTLRVQNDDETALGGEPIPSEAFTYTGVVGEFNESYQLIPVRPGDLETGDGGGTETSTINEARQNVGSTTTIEGTVSRAFGDFARIQDGSGPTGASGLVIRQTGGAFFDDVQSGTIAAGTTLRITGTTSEFNGIVQINEDDLQGYEVLSQGDPPMPQTPSLADLDTNGEDYESELVEITDLTFPEASGTFETSTNYTVEDANGNQLTFRVQSGSESDLGGVAIPEGTFTYTGVVGEFNGSYQLIPVLPSDIGASDDGGSPGTVTINEARSASSEVTFEGTVTRAFGAYARVQDTSGPTGASAIVIRQTGGDNSDAFQSDVNDGTIQPGTVVRITGVPSEFNGLAQVNGGDLTSYEVLSQGEVPAPQTITLADLESNGEDYESELVEIADLTFTEASGTFENGTSYDVTDGTATLTFRVQNDNETALAGESIPSEAFTYNGVTGEFNSNYQLIPVRPSDLQTP